MTISIITVSYNSIETIVDAMESVLRQRHDGFDVEYIVVDGGSVDGTVEVIRDFSARSARSDRFTFKWISEPDEGLYEAMNKGLRMAKGDVVGILNSDDMMASDGVLSHIADEFARRKGLELLFSDIRFVDRGVKIDELRHAVTRRYVCPALWRPWMLTFGYAPPHPGMYIRKDCFERWGHYKSDYRIGADYEMVVRFARKYRARYAYSHICSVAMRLGGASTVKGNAGSFVGNNHDVIRANRENGYCGSRWLILGKLPVKVVELILPKFFPHIGSGQHQ